MTTICVATDMRPNADRAVARAVRLAQNMTARLVVASILPEGSSPDKMTTRKEDLERYMASVSGAEGVPISIEVEAGEAVAEVHRIAQRNNAELIIVGLHRARAILDTVRETTMERLVRTAGAAVLLVKNPADHDYRKAVAAVDFAPASQAAIAAALRIAPSCEVDMLHAVHIPYHTAVAAPGAVGDVATLVDPAPFVNQAEEDAAAWLKDAPELTKYGPVDVKNGPIHNVLSAVLRKAEPNLLILGAHSKHSATDWLLGSVAADMIREPPCDLLISHP